MDKPIVLDIQKRWIAYIFKIIFLAVGPLFHVGTSHSDVRGWSCRMFCWLQGSISFFCHRLLPPVPTHPSGSCPGSVTRHMHHPCGAVLFSLYSRGHCTTLCLPSELRGRIVQWSRAWTPKPACLPLRLLPGQCTSVCLPLFSLLHIHYV